jgi:hypothetical protein
MYLVSSLADVESINRSSSPSLNDFFFILLIADDMYLLKLNKFRFIILKDFTFGALC